jgi:hypothetical protein
MDEGGNQVALQTGGREMGGWVECISNILRDEIGIAYRLEGNFILGAPQATKYASVEYLESQKYIGIYKRKGDESVKISLMGYPHTRLYGKD